MQFVFWTTHGDLYYIGIDALALYDVTGQFVPLHSSQVLAFPSSVNDLTPGSRDDFRIPANLVKEYNPRSV